MNSSQMVTDRRRSRKVITYGTFDMLHCGHIRLLQRARSFGDHLTVAVSTDEFNELKGKKSYYAFIDRKEILESLRYVDQVIAETCWEQKRQDIINWEIDVFVIGDDWRGRFDFLSEVCEVVYLPRTPEVSTTEIKARLREILQ